jgi:hypothetical protein
MASLLAMTIILAMTITIIATTIINDEKKAPQYEAL